jgi:hypothetical protein
MPNGVKAANLLWALMFLKLYCAESVLATLTGAGQKSVDKKTFRKWTWLFVEEIIHLKYRVILFENRLWRRGKHMSHFCGWNRFLDSVHHSTLLDRLVLSQVQGTRHLIQIGSRRHDVRHCLD